MRRLFRQFSFPGGIPSHVAPETPGSIHEGGELGYALVARLRRGVRQPGPARRAASSATARPRPGRSRRAGTRTSSSNPARDGAVLPILHLNGYKIANPTVLARIPRRRAARAARGLRLRAVLRRGRRARRRCTRRWPRRSTRSLDEIARDPARARATDGVTERPRWPMIVLRTPKGWTGPKEVDGVPVEGTCRVAPGAAGRASRDEPGAPRAARGVAALLPARGAVRRRRRARAPSSRALAPDGRRAG